MLCDEADGPDPPLLLDTIHNDSIVNGGSPGSATAAGAAGGLVYDDMLSPASRLNISPTSLANHALHREIDAGDGLVETRTFVFEPTHPRTPSAAELRLKATLELERHRELQSAVALLADSEEDSSDDEAAPLALVESCPWQVHGSDRQMKLNSKLGESRLSHLTAADAIASPVLKLLSSSGRAPSLGADSASSPAPSTTEPKPVRWYRDTSHERGWNPGSALIQSRPFGPKKAAPTSTTSTPATRRTTLKGSLAAQHRRPSSPAVPGSVVTRAGRPTASSPSVTAPLSEASMLVRKTLQRPPSALPPITEYDSMPRHAAPTAALMQGDCGRCSHREHHTALREHELLVQSLQQRAATPLAQASRPSTRSNRPSSRASATPTLVPLRAGGPVETSLLNKPPRPLPVSLRSMERLSRAKANALAPPACSHDDMNPCPSCEAVRKTIAGFECVVMESAQAVLGERSPLVKPMGVQSDDDSEDDRDVNANDANARAMARRGSTFDGLIQPLRKRWRAKEKAVEQAQYAQSAQPVATRTKSPPRASIAELYFDTTHRDREDLYISVVGGLSFDLTREKFRTMVVRVLAPRRGITVTDEQVLNLFSSFDFNGGGTVSYFEYLHALCENLLSKNQQTFLGRLFDRLVATSATAEAMQRRKQRPAEGPTLPIPSEPQVHGESIPFFLSKSSSSVQLSGGTKTEAGGPADSSARLGHQDLTLDAIEKGVFDLLHKSLLFPHPEEAELALAIHTCLADLGPADRIEKSKFILLLFCDDDFIPVFRRHVT